MIIFDSYIEGAQGFPVRIREAFYRAVVEYLYFEREPEGLPAEAMGLFTMIRPNLDESIRKSKAGKLGASRRQSNAKAVEAEERHEEPAELQQKQFPKQCHKQCRRQSPKQCPKQTSSTAAKQTA